jgi:hypothetical protein
MATAQFFFLSPLYSVLRSHARVCCTVLEKKNRCALLQRPVIPLSSSRQPIITGIGCALWPCSLPRPNPKYFIFHPSHQIFQRMHEALNVGKKDN